MPKHKTRTYDGDHSLSWISPDDLWLTDDQDWREENAYWEDEWPKPDLTFVYKDGVLHKAPGKNTHGSIGRSVPEFNTIARGELAEIALLGRVGTACVCSGCGLTVNNCRHGQECDKAYPERKLVASFWNLDDLKELGIDACLNELEDQGFIERGTLVSTPLGTYKYSGEHRAKEATNGDRDRTRLLQQMHLARGNEKKRIMKKLGVGKGEEPEGKMSTQWKKHNAGHYWGMTSDSIGIPGEVIIERIDDENEDYIDPNIICNIETPDECCFIFTDKLYFHKGVECHSGLVRSHPQILADIGFVRNTDEHTDEREALHDRSLLGRIATVPDSLPKSMFYNLEEELGDYVGIQIVSFWTTNRQLYDNLDECMAALDSHGLLAETSLISTPFGNRMWPDGAEIESDELTPEERERIELLQQMHLARGDVKKEIMDKLGLGFEGRPKNKIQTHHNGGDDPTRGAPGKWWSPFGDDINRIANAINENL